MNRQNDGCERCIVLGLGNLLRRDEGLGVWAMERIEERYHLPENVQLVDGGTLGLNLLSYLEEAENVLILDAVLIEGPPGTLFRASGHEVPAFLGMHASPHEIALADLLAVTRLRETEPRKLVVLGLQPATIELGWGLSEVIEAHVDELVEAAVNELRSWGIMVIKRESSVEMERNDGYARSSSHEGRRESGAGMYAGSGG